MGRIPITVADANRCWPRYANKLVPDASRGCLLWTKAKNENGRGMVRIKPALSMVQAHRLAWVFYTQCEVPVGLDVLHTCDVGNCVKPEHLYVGTHDDNMADKVRRGRGAGGLHLPKSAKLEIKRLRELGWKYSELQAHFGVSHTTIIRALKK